MDAVLKWFKKLSLKKKLIAIAVLALAIMMIFSKISGGSRKDNSDKTTTSTKEVQTTEAQAEITTESTTNRTTETTTESTTQSTSAQSETTEKTETKKHGIDPEFKAFWDGYEKFMDSYIKFMKNPDVTSSEYLRFMADYQDYLDKTSEYENDDDLTDEEYKYMTEVELRVSAKLIAAGVS